MKTVLIIVVTLFGVSLGAKLPSDWKSCKGSSESELSACLKSTIQDVVPKLKNGVSSLNIPPLEPLVIPSATIGEGKGAVNVVQNYKNFEIFGIPNAKILTLDAKFTSDHLTIETEAFIPEGKFIADYDLDGRILLLPIKGNGKCQVDLKDLKIKIKLEAERFEKKGKAYLKTTEFKVDIDPGKVTYNFENLFNGDARLGGEMNKILNENWKDVSADVKSGYIKLLESVCLDYTNKVFSKVPLEEMF